MGRCRQRSGRDRLARGPEPLRHHRPTLRVPGWKTDEPKLCHPEYYTENVGRIDQALFRDLKTIVDKGMPTPDIIIEAKALTVRLKDT